jgi:hypothetical protein
MCEDYFASRRFRSPFLEATELVGPASALWAFLLGPIYYWRKRAPIEALLFAISIAALLFVDDDWDVLGGASDIDLGSVIWLIFALAAPFLLPACYRRKGWVEVAAHGWRSAEALRPHPLGQKHN